MGARNIVMAAQDPIGSSSLDALTDAFAALLDLPGEDPEVRDIVGVLHDALQTARQTDRAEVLDDALHFARGRLAARGLLQVGLRDLGDALLVAASAPLHTEQRAHLRILLGRCESESDTPSASQPPAHLGAKSAAYVDQLVLGDRKGALALTRRYATEGMDVFEILVDVLEPAQHEVGRLWALGRISVAQEHFCTAVTEFVMTDLYPAMFNGQTSRRRLVAIHAPGSLHHIGLRMVTDVLECRGWSTNYVGGDVAPDVIASFLADDQADLLLVSASMPGQISYVAELVQAVRDDPRSREVKVVVGGRPFLVSPDLVDAVGADGSARDARSAVDVCEALMRHDCAGEPS